jgi:hypothetical protein
MLTINQPVKGHGTETEVETAVITTWVQETTIKGFIHLIKRNVEIKTVC